MGPLFNVILVFIAVAFVAGVCLIVLLLKGRTLLQAALGAAGFSFGAVCAAALVAFVCALLMGRGAVLHSKLEVLMYLGCLAAAAAVGGVSAANVVARRSNNRWRGP